MTNEGKRNCFKTIFSSCSQDEVVKDLLLRNENGNGAFECKIHNMNVLFDLKKDSDLLILKASKDYPEYEEAELYQFGEEFVKDEAGISFSNYDHHLEFSAPLVFSGMADDVAEAEIKKRTEAFFHFLKTKVSTIDHDLDQAVEQMETKNPFQQFLDKNGVSGSEKGFFTYANIEANHIPMECEYHSGAKTLKLTGFVKKMMMTSKEERKVLDVCEEIGTEFRINTNGYDVILERTIQSESEIDPMIDEFLLLYQKVVERVEEKGMKTPAMEELTKNHPEVKEEIKEEPEKETEAKDATYPQEELCEIPVESETDLDIKKEEKQEDTAPNFKYQQAPSVEKQMMEMLAEMNQTFQTRKELMDFREETLRRREEEFDRKKEQLQKEELVLEETRESMNEQKEKLADSWNQYHSKRKNLDQRENDLRGKEQAFTERMREFSKREQSVNDKTRNLVAKEKSASDMLEAAKEKEKSMMQKEQMLEEKQQQLSVIEMREKQLEFKEAQIKDQKASLEEFDRKLKERKELLDCQEKSIDQDYYDEKAKQVILELEEKLKMSEEKQDSLQNELEEQKTQVQEKQKEIFRLQTNILEQKEKAEENEKEKEELLRLRNLTDVLQNRSKELELQLEESKKNNKEKKEETESLGVQEEMNFFSTLELLKESGICMERLNSAEEEIYVGEYQNCKIFLKKNEPVLYVEHPVKKGVKYIGKLQEWNQKDFKEAYMCEERKLICKKVIQDLPADIISITELFSSLK